MNRFNMGGTEALKQYIPFASSACDLRRLPPIPHHHEFLLPDGVRWGRQACLWT